MPGFCWVRWFRGKVEREGERGREREREGERGREGERERKRDKLVKARRLLFSFVRNSFD